MTRQLEPCHFTKGNLVEVREEGVRPWRGTVHACKPSPVSGWWLDVRDSEGFTYQVAEAIATRVPLNEGRAHL